MRIASVIIVAAALGSACGTSDKATGPGGSVAVLTTLGISAPGNTITLTGSMQLSASPKDQNGAAFPATVLWTSTSNFVALVTPLGFVTAVAGGQAYMRATSGSLKDSTLITVVTGAYPSSQNVYMLPLAYTPVQTDIAQGGTVTFVFVPQAHNVFFNVVAGAPANIPGEVSNQNVLRTFNTKGTFGYKCTLHPEMVATITVH